MLRWPRARARPRAAGLARGAMVVVRALEPQAWNESAPGAPWGGRAADGRAGRWEGREVGGGVRCHENELAASPEKKRLGGHVSVHVFVLRF